MLHRIFFSFLFAKKKKAECPECQQDILRQTHAFNSDGVPVGPSTNHIHAARRSSSIGSSGRLKVCSAHRSRAQPGEGGLPGLDDHGLGSRLGLVEGGGVVSGGAAGGGGGIGGGVGEEGGGFRPRRRGMGKTRKKQLSSKTAKYEGGYSHGGGCCSVQ